MKYVVLIVGIFFCLATLARGDEMVMVCLQDAELDEEEPGVKKGSGQDVMIGATWGEPELLRAYGLFEFEDDRMFIPEYYTVVNEAILTLFIVSNDNDAEVEFFSAAEEWNEASVTWDSRPAEDRDIVVIDTAPPLEPPTQLWEIDVTEIVQTWYGYSPVHAFGLYLSVPDNGVVVDIDVVSKDHPDTSLHPRLWMDFDMVGVSEELEPLDNSFSVSQVSPDRVEISYSLPNATQASLKVYDASGSLVQTLVEGQSSAGNHQLAWSAENPGIYFIKLDAGEFRATRKAVIVR